MVLLVLAACGGSDAPSAPPPPPPFVFTITGNQTQTGRTELENGVLSYGCPFTFAATASGGAGDELVGWQNAEIAWHLVTTGANQTTNLTAQDLQDWFGADRIHPGSVATASQNMFWSGPFTVAITFRYAVFTDAEPGGEARSSTVFAACN